MIRYEEVRIRISNLTNNIMWNRATDKYAYTAGFLSSLLTETLNELPEHKCRAMLDKFDRIVAEQIESMNESA
jgi:hypothetical protein